MPTSPHHHGNLRNALIDKAIELSADSGFENLSLRRLAHAVGVSHAAPAHHFGNKQGLIQAIAARGFLLFAEIMRTDRARAGPDPHDRLLGICEGYLRFSQQHEALFELIFTTEMKNASDPELIAASGEAFEVLVETCAPFVASPHGPGVNEIAIWSLVHGYATLRRFNRAAPVPGGPPLPFADLLPTLIVKET